MLQVKALIGQLINLVPLEESHREILRSLANDETIWAYMPSDARGKGFDGWFDKALKEKLAGEHVPFVVQRKEDNRIVGSSRFYNIFPEHKRLSIGYTWYIQEARGTAVNPEAKFLLLECVFEHLNFNRVEFHVDSRNVRSRAAVKKLGAIEEGILRQHMIVHETYVRDTVVFSIIKTDWPNVKAKLKSRCYC